MKDSKTTSFPNAFGACPDDFLERYESLIYKVIAQHIQGDSRFEIEDLFQDFFIHISEDRFRRLRYYRGECMQTTYLGKILRNFIYDQYRKRCYKNKTKSLDEIHEQGNEIASGDSSYQADVFKEGLLNDALKEAFTKLSNKEKLMFDAFLDGDMSAKEIANLYGVKVKKVYKNNEKIKRILKEELEKRGINDF